MRNSEKTLTYGTSALKASKKTASYLQYRHVKQTNGTHNRARIHLIVPFNVMPTHEQVFDKRISYYSIASSSSTKLYAMSTKADISIHNELQHQQYVGAPTQSGRALHHCMLSASTALAAAMKRACMQLKQSVSRTGKRLSDKSVVLYDLIYNDARGIPFDHGFDAASKWWGLAFLLASGASLYIALMQ